MNPVRRQRLIIVLLIACASATAVGLTTYALRESINLFYLPEKFTNGEVPVGDTVRAGGMVVNGSLKRATDSLQVTFQVGDFVDGTGHAVTVEYDDILPDLFREGQGVVITGTWTPEGVLVADEVLAKHDESYMPPEVKETMRNAQARLDLKE